MGTQGSRTLTQLVARGTVINAAASAIAGGLFAVRNLIAAAFMGPTGLAVWAVSGAVLLTATALRGVGVVERFVADRDRPAREAFNDAFSVGLLFSTAVGLVVAIATPIFALAYDDDRLYWALLAVAGLVVADGLKFPIWWHYRELRFGTQRALMLADAIGSVAFALPLLAWGWEYWGLIAGAAIASVFTIVLAWVVGPRPRPSIPTRETIRRYTSFGGPILGFALVGVLITHLGYLTLRHSVGLEALGYLAVAALPYLAAERLSSVLNQSVYPALVQRGESSREQATETMQRIVWAIMAPILFAIATTAPFLIKSALGDVWATAGLLMSVVALGTVIRMFGFTFAVAVMSTGRTREIGRFAVIYLLVAIFVVIPFTFAFGLAGYSVGIIIVELLLARERWRIMRQVLPGANLFRGLSGDDLVVALLPAICAGAAFAATPGMSGPGRLALATVLGLIGAVPVVIRHLPLARFMLAGLRGSRADQEPEQPLAPMIGPKEATTV